MALVVLLASNIIAAVFFSLFGGFILIKYSKLAKKTIFFGFASLATMPVFFDATALLPYWRKKATHIQWPEHKTGL